MRVLNFFLYIMLFIFGIQQSFAAINFNVSPIKYEIDINPGVSLSKTATLINSGDTTVTIYTGKSDFQTNGDAGLPAFVRYSELVHPDQQLSSWITIDTDEFIITPGEKKTINFVIDVPENATPGGHYGAVFFKNPASEESGGSQKIGINVDYGILILLNVSGDIVTDIDIQDPVINSKGGYNNYSNTPTNLSSPGSVGYNNKDNCLVDFTNSNFDGKCFDDLIDLFAGGEQIDYISKLGNGDGVENNLNGEKELLTDNSNSQEDSGFEKDNPGMDTDNNGEQDDFEIGFTFPIKNSGNIHIKPSGKIKLIDEDGDQIKGVGKKNILSDDGAIIGTEVVDYIPINDNGGNVLPDSLRKFQESWKGFPYQTLDENGVIVMKDMSPDEYYTKQNLGENTILMPWQRICYRKSDKTIKALIDMVYTDHEGNEIEYSSAQEFPVSYTEKYIGMNLYIVVPFFFILFVIFFLWLIIFFKRRRCVNMDCKKRLKKKMLICPYCGTKQPKYKEKSDKTIAKKIVRKKTVAKKPITRKAVKKKVTKKK